MGFGLGENAKSELVRLNIKAHALFQSICEIF